MTSSLLLRCALALALVASSASAAAASASPASGGGGGGKKAKAKRVPRTFANADDATAALFASVGKGDLKAGHEALDLWVRMQRRKTIQELKKLPGPSRD